MIALKILLWIFGAIVALILLVMILPVSVKVGYVDKKVILKVKYAFINVFELGGKGILNRLMGDGKKESKAPEPVKSPEASAAESPAESRDKPEVDPNKPEETHEAVQDEQEAVQEAVEDKPENVSKAAEKPEEDSHTRDEGGSTSDEDEPEEKENGKSLTEKIDFFHDIWHAAGRPALKIFKGFKFSEFYVDFLIANEDAYKCALNYGRISGAVYYVLGWFGVLFNMKYKTVDINPGFDMKESRWDVSFKLSFNIMNVVIAGLWFLITYIFRILIPSKRMKKKMKKAAMQK